MTPYQSEDPSPTLPTYRGKEEKGKIVEDKKGESNYANKRALDLLLKSTNEKPTTLLYSISNTSEEWGEYQKKSLCLLENYHC